MARSNYYAKLKSYHGAVTNAKRAAFLREAQKLAQTNPFALLKKLKTHGKPLSSMVNNIVRNGVWHVTDSEKVEVLADAFFFGGGTSAAFAANHTAHLNPETDFPPITPNEVSQAIKDQPALKAPWLDEIQAILLHWAEGDLLEPLTFLFNACLRLSHFPTALKQTKVIILPKPGKEDYSDVKSYRPILLISIFGRVLERIIYRRFLHLSSVASKPWISANQFGFQSQKSAVDALDHETTK